jgi:hypothetical protein
MWRTSRRESGEDLPSGLAAIVADRVRLRASLNRLADETLSQHFFHFLRNVPSHPLLDHVVVGDGSYVSLLEVGLLGGAN